LAVQYNRSMLKETSRAAVQKMVDAGCNEDAAKALEDIEDYNGAISLYIRAKKFDAAETLAQRISPDLVEKVKRARVQHAMEGGGGVDGEIKEAISNNDWEKALKIARQSGPEQARIYASMYCTQVLLQEKNVEKALAVIARDGMETADLRFFKGFVSLTNVTISKLPNNDWDLQPLHDGMYKMLESMKNTGQPDEDIARANNALSILHAYYMRQVFASYDMKEHAAWVMLSLPRHIPAIPADKAYFDAANAAKDANLLGIAFQFFNRFLDISDQIEEGEKDSSGMTDIGDFENMDYPHQFPLPPKLTIDEEVAKEARGWVLARSLEDSFDRSMPMITDPTTNTPMFFAQLKSSSGTSFESCAITGLPLFSGDPKTRCKGCQRPAKIDAWNKYVAVSKSCPWCKTSASVVLK
jgi:intraflagellar transport protein 172